MLIGTRGMKWSVIQFKQRKGHGGDGRWREGEVVLVPPGVSYCGLLAALAYQNDSQRSFFSKKQQNKCTYLHQLNASL